MIYFYCSLGFWVLYSLYVAIHTYYNDHKFGHSVDMACWTFGFIFLLPVLFPLFKVYTLFEKK